MFVGAGKYSYTVILASYVHRREPIIQLFSGFWGGPPRGMFRCQLAKNCTTFTSSFHSHTSLSLLVSRVSNNVHIKPFPLVCLFWDLTLNWPLIRREKGISSLYSHCPFCFHACFSIHHAWWTLAPLPNGPALQSVPTTSVLHRLYQILAHVLKV